MLVIYDNKQIIESNIDAKKLTTLDLLRLINKLSVGLVGCDGGTKENVLPPFCTRIWPIHSTKK